MSVSPTSSGDQSPSSPFQSAQPRQNQIPDSPSIASSSSQPEAPSCPQVSPPAVSAPPNPQHQQAQHAPPSIQDASSSESSSTSYTLSPFPPPPRPNKYHGPPSTWRTWTAPERELAASLDQIQAADLSIHLYNAFALKKMAGVGHYRRKHEDDEDAQWAPPRVWTAWPMRADEVPREEERKRWEDDGLFERTGAQGAQNASELLSELLVARVLKKAKERFEGREWESEQPESSSDDARSRSKKKKAERTSKGELTYTRGSINDPTLGGEIIGTRESEQDLKPIVTADDDHAATILQPSIQHILSKLDSLLLALHTARASYAGPKARKRRRNREDRVDKKSSMSTSKRRPNPSSQSHSDSSSSSATSQSQTSTLSMSPPSSPQRSLYKKSFAPEYWSTVLGMASLTNWEPAIVERAAERCASLFGEEMAFRCFDPKDRGAGEGGLLRIIRGVGGTGDGMKRARENDDNLGEEGIISEEEDDDEEEEDDDSGETPADQEEMYGGVHVDGYLQPIEGRRWWGQGAKKRRASASGGRSSSETDGEAEL